MHINKLIAINALTDRVVYEIGNEIISVHNQAVYYVNVYANNRLVVVGRDKRFELECVDSSVMELLIRAGFIQMIREQKIELKNLLLLPYTEAYKSNIDQFLTSILNTNS
jgi:hypothetical protein